MSNTLEFGAVVRKPDIRYARDMSDVILDRDWLEENKETELYYMYRDLWKKGDRDKILEAGLRYDITIIPSREMGKEYVKTKGHYHPEIVKGITYPEIYEVLEGKAHYLLQKKSSKGIEDVILIEAETGEKAIIPPNYGHITINPSSKTLKMANWVDRRFNSIYKDIMERQGGAYYELVGKDFVKNNNYRNIPPIKRRPPTELPELGIISGENMYELIDNPKNLEFLSKPEKYMKIFSI